MDSTRGAFHQPDSTILPQHSAMSSEALHRFSQSRGSRTQSHKRDRCCNPEAGHPLYIHIRDKGISFSTLRLEVCQVRRVTVALSCDRSGQRSETDPDFCPHTPKGAYALLAPLSRG